jgi:glycosyltransferase involved in cell wall biosynthesis
VDRFVGNSGAVADSVHSAFGIPRADIDVIYDGVVPEEWRSAVPPDLTAWGVSDAHIVCLTTARLHPQKDIGTLVRAAKEAIAERPNLRFLIAGEGPLRPALEAEIAALGVEDEVRLLGWRADVDALLARADLYVFPSRFEGLPSSVIEAMAAGVPVVASAVAGVTELVTPGRTGWLVPPGTAPELAAAIVEAAGSDLPALGRVAAAEVDERFSIEAMTEAFERVYEELAGTPAS